MDEQAFKVWWDPAAKIREVATGVGVISRATIEAFEVSVGKIKVEVIYDTELKRLAVESIATSRAKSGEEITSVNLRAIRVFDYLAWAGHYMAYFKLPNGEWDREPIASSGLLDLATIDRGESVDDYALRLYSLATVINLPPLKTVADYLEVSQSTATRLIARARADGRLS